MAAGETNVDKELRSDVCPLFNFEIYRILCAFNFLSAAISLMGMVLTRHGPTEEEKKKKKKKKERKEEKEAWKNNQAEQMNHLDPEDAIFLIDAFLDESKVNNSISVMEKTY